MDSETRHIVNGSIIVILLCVFLTVCGYMVWPQYRLYSKRMLGRAKLAEATSSRQISVQTAKAHLAAAKYDAQAEVARAIGVAKANKIIGKSLKDNDEYLKYLWINGMKKSNHSVVYVPTETQLPILEASKNPLTGGYK